jgi:hypothetical protein
MTSGFGVQLPFAPTDPSLPILRDDLRLTAGSMMLLDPAHPVNPWPAGVPADASTVPNLAWRECQALTGTGTQSSLAALVARSAAITGSLGLLERSAKGGLHLLLSAATAPAGGQGFAIRPAVGVVDWMVAHPTHAYYFSIFMKRTRFGNAFGNVLGASLNAAPSDTEVFASIGPDGTTSPTSSGKRTGYRRTRTYWRPAQDAAVTPPFSQAIMANVAVSGYTGTPGITGATAQAQMKLFGGGRLGPFADVVAGMPSSVLWSAHWVDLTAAGMTYADMDALEYAEFQKQCLNDVVGGVGGRYYGDTYTDPATIA